MHDIKKLDAEEQLKRQELDYEDFDKDRVICDDINRNQSSIPESIVFSK